MPQHTGCRRGELFALRALAAWKKRDGAIHAKGLIFPATSTGKSLKDIKHHWRKLKTAAGIEDVKWHDLYHTFAANLARADLIIPPVSGLAEVDIYWPGRISIPSAVMVASAHGAGTILLGIA